MKFGLILLFVSISGLAGGISCDVINALGVADKIHVVYHPGPYGKISHMETQACQLGESGNICERGVRFDQQLGILTPAQQRWPIGQYIGRSNGGALVVLNVSRTAEQNSGHRRFYEGTVAIFKGGGRQSLEVACDYLE